MKTGQQLINEERQRQIQVEGWTPEHDDTHRHGELFRAALCYLNCTQANKTPPLGWPWHSTWWRPKDSLRNLVRAGALLRAEQERLKRLEQAVAAVIDAAK